MALETVTHISDLVASNPAATDPKSQGDDHIRNIKLALKTDFPNISGPVTASHTELNFMDGATTQPAMKDGSNLVTPTIGDSSTKIATTAFVAETALSIALPAQTGNAGKYITTNGSVASWQTLPLQVVRSERTSNTALAVADNQSLVDITSGTFTQTFTAAATLGSGWYCYIRNSGTGDITLDPNGSETIDGLTSFVMYPGEVRLVQCTGSAFHSIVIQAFNKTFTSTANFIKPPGYQYFGGLLWGAGGSGAKVNTTYVGGGGGGACSAFLFPASSFAASELVTIGAGGAAQTSAGVNGIAGGASSIGTLLTAPGGSGGSSSGSSAGDVSTGSQGGAAYNVVGVTAAIYNGRDGSPGAALPSVYGGAGGAGVSTATGYAGAASVFGGAGGASSNSGNGTDGTAPGGGGGATATGSSSGAGARGELRIWGQV